MVSPFSFFLINNNVLLQTKKKEVKPISPNCTTMLAYIIQDHLSMQREDLFYLIGIL